MTQFDDLGLYFSFIF